jgi:hypothetical protein
MNSTNANVSSGATVPITLLCGCLDNTRDFMFLLSYVAKPDDKLSELVARFGSSLLPVVALNNISNENVLSENRTYYLPINICEFLFDNFTIYASNIITLLSIHQYMRVSVQYLPINICD